MGVIGGTIGYELLRRISPRGENGACDGNVYAGRSKLEVLFGAALWEEIEGKRVVDFGCGEGAEAVELAERGAREVVGIDNREQVLNEARRRAERAGVADRCRFAAGTDEPADVVLSLDAFEHFEDPAAVLKAMRRLLKPDGCVLAVFGPTWYHPFGGHLFSVFPWAHLLFTERALIRWRSDFKTDGATRFHEVEGGLNQMTVRRFRKLIDESDFRFERFEPVPIRRLKWLSNPLTREFTTAVVRCKLVPKGSARLSS
ncbi:MAG TPA: class I SAM-dependent methyltransferase [Pyrinomonadaceae bacterium]|nr:class I SAM-dependent methyltransferase [Pyrinomonadaceae bacterium]